MIHTCDLFIKLESSNVRYFQDKYGVLFDSKVLPHENGIKVGKIYCNEVNGWSATLHIEAIKLLGKNNILETDLSGAKLKNKCSCPVDEQLSVYMEYPTNQQPLNYISCAVKYGILYT